MVKYHILSLDGGGIRGLLTARILERILKEYPQLFQHTDLFAGVSTGSILAVGLAKSVVFPQCSLTPSLFVELYKDKSREIFHPRMPPIPQNLVDLVEAKYNTENRYAVIHEYIGNITLGELLPKHILIPTFQLDSSNAVSPARPQSPHTWKPKFFHNFSGDDSDGAQNAVDVIMRSSSAPIYFPVYQGFVDGGVAANNPSMCAFTQAVSKENGAKKRMSEIALLSIGTGSRNKNITSRDGDWGYFQWGLTPIDLLFDSGSGVADYQCRQLLGNRYQRIDPDLKEDIGLDALDKLERLIEIADSYDLTDVIHWLKIYWQD